MTIRAFFAGYRLSALGLASLFVSLGLGLGVFFASTSPFLGLGGFVLSLLLVDGLVLATGLGAKAAAKEEDRRLAREAYARLEAGSQSLDRLEALRLGDNPVAAARDYFVLQARSFIEVCSKRLAEPSSTGPLYDPEALAAIPEALDLIDAWQHEVDESSVERRFQAKDAHGVESANERVTAALAAAATRVIKGRDGVTASLPASDRLAIQEELSR